MEIIFVVLFTASFIFISWLLYTLAQGDISKIFNWAKYLYIIVFPLSCFMWIYESVKTGEWLEAKNITTIFFLINVIYIVLMFLFWLIFNKSRNRKPRGSMKYGISYYDKGIESYNNYVQQRTMMFLVVALVINPILNVFCMVQFIKAYFL